MKSGIYIVMMLVWIVTGFFMLYNPEFEFRTRVGLFIGCLVIAEIYSLHETISQIKEKLDKSSK